MEWVLGLTVVGLLFCGAYWWGWGWRDRALEAEAELRREREIRRSLVARVSAAPSRTTPAGREP